MYCKLFNGYFLEIPEQHVTSGFKIVLNRLEFSEVYQKILECKQKMILILRYF